MRCLAPMRRAREAPAWLRPCAGGAGNPRSCLTAALCGTAMLAVVAPSANVLVPMLSHQTLPGWGDHEASLGRAASHCIEGALCSSVIHTYIHVGTHAGPAYTDDRRQVDSLGCRAGGLAAGRPDNPIACSIGGPGSQIPCVRPRPLGPQAPPPPPAHTTTTTHLLIGHGNDANREREAEHVGFSSGYGVSNGEDGAGLAVLAGEERKFRGGDRVAACMGGGWWVGGRNGGGAGV